MSLFQGGQGRSNDDVAGYALSFGAAVVGAAMIVGLAYWGIF